MAERSWLLGRVDEVEQHMSTVRELSELHELRGWERQGKNRKGVHRALNDREAELLALQPQHRYRVRRSVSLDGLWITEHRRDRLRYVSQRSIQEALRSGALEEIDASAGEATAAPPQLHSEAANDQES
jgi:hypothetical protein